MPSLNRKTATIAILFLTILFLLLSRILQPSKEEYHPMIIDSSNWEIDGSGNVSAAIIWQKAESRERATTFSNVANNTITSSRDTFVYYQSISNESEAQLIAFNLQTGQETWHFSNFMDNFRYLVSINDDFAFTSDAGAALTLLSHDGEIVWNNGTFGSRFLLQIYPEDASLFLPSYSILYEVSLNTGQAIQTLNIPNIVGFYGDIIVTASTQNSIQILEFPSEKLLYNIDLPSAYANAIEAALGNHWQFTQRNNDTLFVYDNPGSPTQIRAYSIQDGQLLWFANVRTLGFPVVLNNKLIVYTSDGIQIYDPATGNPIGHINLVEKTQNSTQFVPPLHVSLAGYNNTIVVNYWDTWEIVALRTDVESR